MKKNNSLIASNPIGIIDSGMGGLTIAKIVAEQLPHEDIIYFADTANLPYGNKDAESIKLFISDILEKLAQHHCKLILFACHSASATAYDMITKPNDDYLMVNVVDTTFDLIKKNYNHKTIGLIGTQRTIHSNIYQKKIAENHLDIKLRPHATPLLASSIESAFEDPNNSSATTELLHEYLSHENLQGLDALVLVCTHYPIIKDKITLFFNHAVDIVDPSYATAEEVRRLLTQHNLLNPNSAPGKVKFFASGGLNKFMKNAKPLLW